MTENPHSSDDTATAYKDGKKPGPNDSTIQVRDAGDDNAATTKPADWDKQDEAVDESFPASDASAKY